MGIKSISEFVFMKDELGKADVILIPGASRPELVYRAIELFEQKYAEYILISGSCNATLPGNQTEAKFLSQLAIEKGVPPEQILIEPNATHTFENAELSLKLLLKSAIKFNKVILVCKASHSRRAYLTYKTVFPKNTKFFVQSIIDSRQIRKDNWMLNSKKIEYVMNEVTKIGTYFKSHISDLYDKENTT